MRVYELAKKLGMENRELIPELKRMGITVASHSSALDDETARRVIERLTPKGKISVKSGAKTAESGDHMESRTERKGSRSHREEASAALQASARETLRDSGRPASARLQPSVVEEPPKPDKRRILIKRKKTEESAAETVSGAPSEISAKPGLPLQDAARAAGPSPTPEVTAPPAVESQIESVQPPTRPPDHAPVGPQPELREAKPTQPAPASAVEPLLSVGKKKSFSIETLEPEGVGLKDKLKKVRKPGRAREEEDVRFRDDAARWEDLRAIPVHRREDRSRHVQPSSVAEITKPRKKSVKLAAGLTVKEFAELIGQRPADIVRKLMEMGQMLTFNQPINLDAAVLIAEEFGVKAEVSTEKAVEELLEEAAEGIGDERLEPRPPVVTIMGHVDHGKTSLLDAIRKTRVTEQEAGGITQHIGAHQVTVQNRKITFLDTPGHEAFTLMRARGAKVTDIVVLVVAADDGVMPQTEESISHTKAAKVPIVVAINKIDKPGVNPERVKRELAERGLQAEDWGGDTPTVEVSAKTGKNLELLLELILLVADLQNLKADPTLPAMGAVLEAKIDKGRGNVATVLVQNGTLRVGDNFVAGAVFGKVRALFNEHAEIVKEAGPATPVEVLGLQGLPQAGELFQVIADDAKARQIAQDRQDKARDIAMSKTSRLTLDQLHKQLTEGEVKEVPLILKCDVQGSQEALSEMLNKLSTDKVKVRIMHSSVGAITETDVLLAAASNAIIIGFNVRPERKAAELANREKVDIRLHTIIYNVVDEIKRAMQGVLEPVIKETYLGTAEVRNTFRIPKVGVIAGSYVTDGKITRGAEIRLLRDNVVIFEGKIASLKRFKEDASEVARGYECGIGIQNFNDVKVGDQIEAFVTEKVMADVGA